MKPETQPWMKDEQIKYMVNRFLMWRLPENFNPDGGISFEPVRNAGTVHEYKRNPVGTNLLDALQAEAMIRYLVDGLPVAAHAPQQWIPLTVDEIAKIRTWTEKMAGFDVARNVGRLLDALPAPPVPDTPNKESK